MPEPVVCNIPERLNYPAICCNTVDYCHKKNVQIINSLNLLLTLDTPQSYENDALSLY
jgi:hypothetical protein